MRNLNGPVATANRATVVSRAYQRDQNLETRSIILSTVYNIYFSFFPNHNHKNHDYKYRWISFAFIMPYEYVMNTTEM